MLPSAPILILSQRVTSFSAFDDHGRLEGEHRLVERRQIVDLDGAAALRDHDQPWPARIVHDPQLAKAEPDHFATVAFKLSVELETAGPVRHVHVSLLCQGLRS